MRNCKVAVPRKSDLATVRRAAQLAIQIVAFCEQCKRLLRHSGNKFGHPLSDAHVHVAAQRHGGRHSCLSGFKQAFLRQAHIAILDFAQKDGLRQLAVLLFQRDFAAHPLKMQRSSYIACT